jgi:hypothetical protein
MKVARKHLIHAMENAGRMVQFFWYPHYVLGSRRTKAGWHVWCLPRKAKHVIPA